MRPPRTLILLPLLLLTGCPTKAKLDFDGSMQSDGSADETVTTPTLQITSPIDGSHVKGTLAVIVTATGGKAPASVSLLVDAATTPIATATAPSPYSFAWDTTAVAEGPHTIVAKAIVAGQAITSAPITVNVDRTAPTVVATTPSTGATNVVLRAPITVTFSEAIAKTSLTSSSVMLKIGGAAVATTVTVSSDGTTATIAINDLTSFALPAAVAVTLAATITDLAGNALVPLTAAWSWTVPDFIGYGSIAGLGFSLGQVNLAVTSGFRPIISYNDLYVSPSGGTESNILHLQSSDGQSWTDLGWPGPGVYKAAGPSLALDTNDRPAVAWSGSLSSSGQSQIYVATQTATGWNTALTPTDSAANAGNATLPILRLDPNGLPVVGWMQQVIGIDGYEDIFLTRWTGSQWTSSPGELGLSGITSFDLVVDAQGNPSVGWHSSNMTGLDTFKVTTKQVGPSMAATIDPTLSLDGTSEPLIVATSGSTVVVDTLVGGTWQQMIPTSIPANGTATSFRLREGPDHNPAVGWIDAGQFGFARWTGEVWDTRAGLFSQGGSVVAFDMVVDSQGTAWFAGTTGTKAFVLMSNY